MSDCTCSANDQLKAIQARIDRIDEDLTCHYAGLSTAVIGLAANPLTAGSVAALLPIYNLTSAGQTLIKSLMRLIPGYETFKALQQLQASALVEGMGNALAAQAANIAMTAIDQIEQAVTARIDAELALAQAEAAGAIEEVLAPLRQAVADAQAVVDEANRIEQVVGKFLQVLTDIASCRTRSQDIH